MTATFRITARRECKFCHGSGTVTDYVDYGSTVVGMNSDCDACVEAGWPDGADDDAEYELVPWDYEAPAPGIACQSGNHDDCSGETCGCFCHHDRPEFPHGEFPNGKELRTMSEPPTVWPDDSEPDYNPY